MHGLLAHLPWHGGMQGGSIDGPSSTSDSIWRHMGMPCVGATVVATDSAPQLMF